MSRNKRKKRKGGGGGGQAITPKDPATIASELETMIAQIESGSVGDAVWGQVHKTLLKSPIEAQDAARVITMRDLDGLRAFVRVLRGEGTSTSDDDAPAETSDTNPNESTAPEIPAETRKQALRAFRKRLKLTRLDHESRLGHGPMSSGKKASFDGILPPREFPEEVWEALADEGHLKRLGRGFYQLIE